MRVSAVAPNSTSKLAVTAQPVRGTTVLRAEGLLDSNTYHALRDTIIKAALDEPAAVVIDVAGLRVPAPSAWVVFTSARWHVGRWPEVPILLVCDDTAGREAISRNGVTRYVSVYPTVEEAIDTLSDSARHRYRRRAQAQLPAKLTSLRRSRDLVTEWLTAWSQTDLIPVTKVVVTAFVENVLQHTDSAPAVRLETDGTTVAVAVADAGAGSVVLREDGKANGAASGLRVVAALCRMWGTAPTPAGKTVWAVLGPENRL
ncbi:STAS domain-containing protein [Mycobacterium sp.]|uniref:STAS domain-containing protein n=1 Tax=Mycobacterium sp. TaxID=1785 RepID=UPI0033403AF0